MLLPRRVAGRYQDAAGRWGGFGVALEQGLALLGARGLLAEAGAVPGD